ncbi:peptidase family M16-domain-containing protein [Amanita rubescens]|nr:peptidase family M16-domain-containing protein [Amanita rubescens]
MRFFRAVQTALLVRGVNLVGTDVRTLLARFSKFSWDNDTSVLRVQRIARNYATVVDAAGVKVASVDHGQPTSTVTILAKAGSRFQPKAGVAHALKNFAFKSTTKRSALATVRESELYGGVLSATLGREYLSLTAEFLRGDEELFVDILSSFVTSAKFTRHEYEEYVKHSIETEAEAANSDPTTRAIELAHNLAFRSGLGSSLLAKLSKEYFNLQASATSTVPASKYYGGESRVESSSGPQTLFIGFGTSDTPPADLAVLSAHLSPEPSIKWSDGLSPMASIPKDSSVQSLYLPYSDGTLLGLLVQGTTATSVKEAGKAAVQALKSAASGLKEDELKRAVAKAKFNAAQAADRKDGLVHALGVKVLAGVETSLDATLTSLSGVSASSLSKTTSGLLAGRPTFAAVGSIDALPYTDEIGL